MQNHGKDFDYGTEEKPYVKPMLVFQNFETGELTGSPEMIAQIQEECARLEAENPVMKCPFEDGGFPCHIR